MEERLPEPLEVTWRWFSLEQVNSVEGPEWKVWERPAGHKSRSLLAFTAGESARRQGSEAFQRFHLTLLQARHVDRLPLQDIDTILTVANQVGLDGARLARDMADPDILLALARDHQEAVSLGVFGTPTLFFENGRSAYLKMRPAPPDDEVLDVFTSLRTLIAFRPYIAEIKRPNPPD